jgi:catechol 2,3-dioxygenase-like lactoylglutathione lyase family enzyme
MPFITEYFLDAGFKRSRGKLSCMAPSIEKISAVTFRVANMTQPVRFYRDVLGIKLLYGGEGTGFSSLRARDAQSAILNLEPGEPVTSWGRLIFYPIHTSPIQQDCARTCLDSVFACTHQSLAGPATPFPGDNARHSC